MGDSFLSSIGWLGLANAAVSALLVGLALASTRCSRSTTLVSLLWTLAILKLISPALTTIPLPLPAFAWADTDPAPAVPRPVGSTRHDPAARQNGQNPRAQTVAAPSGTTPPAPLTTEVIHWSALLNAFFVIWGLGIVALASLAAARVVALRRLIRSAQHAPDWVEHEVAACCRSMGIRRPPRVRMLEIAISPLVGAVGWSPILLLPGTFYIQLSKAERQLLLAHEIAHLRRWDHLRAWLELVAVTIFWWDPLAWYARRRSREAAEDCCDSWVVHWFPERAAEYAEVLLKCVDLGSRPARRLPGPMYAMSRFALTRQRLVTILSSPRPPHMSRRATAAVLAIALVFLCSIPVAGQPRTTAGNPPRSHLETLAGIDLQPGPQQATSTSFFVDLQPHANVRLDADFGRRADNNLKSLPLGRHTFAGTEFDVGPGMILLGSGMAPSRPLSARGIKVGRRADSLHLLHGAAWTPEEDGTEIGALLVRYANGSREKVPIVYGVDVRDWWDVDDSFPVTRGKVIWTGFNKGAYSSNGNPIQLRLYGLSWINPHPERVIESIDYISAYNGSCSPFLIGMTAKTSRD